jgi:hypothetical protein
VLLFGCNWKVIPGGLLLPVETASKDNDELKIEDNAEIIDHI